jgi:hypothetical protein
VSFETRVVEFSRCTPILAPRSRPARALLSSKVADCLRMTPGQPRSDESDPRRHIIRTGEC